MANKELCKYIIGTEDIEQYAWHMWEESECDISEKEMEDAIKKLVEIAAAPCESDCGVITNFEEWLWGTTLDMVCDSVNEAISIATTEYIRLNLDKVLFKED